MLYCDHFYVTLLSNASSVAHVDNTQASFTFDLAQPINVASTGDRWEVGLCELSTPPTCSGTYKVTPTNVTSEQTIDFVKRKSFICPGSFLTIPIIMGILPDRATIAGTLNQATTAFDLYGDEHILTCCDVITPQLVGENILRSLRTVSTPCTFREHIFQRVYYMPLEKGLIRSIYIELQTQHGRQLTFKDSRYVTKVVLHFRHVRNIT